MLRNSSNLHIVTYVAWLDYAYLVMILIVFIYVMAWCNTRIVILDNLHGSNCLALHNIQPHHAIFSLLYLDDSIAKRGRILEKKSLLGVLGAFEENLLFLLLLASTWSLASISSLGPCTTFKQTQLMLFRGLSIYSSRGRLRDHVEVSPCL